MDNYNKIMGCVLIADVVGFSELNDNELSQFFNTKDVLDEELCKQKSILQNTWGDAVIAVFQNTTDAIDYAINLRNFFVNTDWDKLDIKSATSIRVGIHAAMFYLKKNKITGKDDVVGTQINKTARLEPVVTPNQIWVTSTFKEMDSAVHPSTSYQYKEIGKVELAKSWGSELVFCLVHKNDIDSIEKKKSIESGLLQIEKAVNEYCELAKHGKNVAGILNVFRKNVENNDNFPIHKRIEWLEKMSTATPAQSSINQALYNLLEKTDDLYNEFRHRILRVINEFKNKKSLEIEYGLNNVDKFLLLGKEVLIAEYSKINEITEGHNFNNDLKSRENQAILDMIIASLKSSIK
jgi:hypothetical protein